MRFIYGALDSREVRDTSRTLNRGVRSFPSLSLVRSLSLPPFLNCFFAVRCFMKLSLSLSLSFSPTASRTLPQRWRSFNPPIDINRYQRQEGVSSVINPPFRFCFPSRKAPSESSETFGSVSKALFRRRRKAWKTIEATLTSYLVATKLEKPYPPVELNDKPRKAFTAVFITQRESSRVDRYFTHLNVKPRPYRTCAWLWIVYDTRRFSGRERAWTSRIRRRALSRSIFIPFALLRVGGTRCSGNARKSIIVPTIRAAPRAYVQCRLTWYNCRGDEGVATPRNRLDPHVLRLLNSVITTLDVGPVKTSA